MSALLILIYAVNIGISLYAIFALPMRGELNKFYEAYRMACIVLGFLPCFVIGTLFQVIILSIYYFVGVKRAQATSHKAEAAFSALASGQVSTDGNPFGGGRAPARSHGTGDNPFASGPAPASPPQPSANPFAAGASLTTSPTADAEASETCSGCGHPTREGDRFCRACGHDLA